MSIGVVTLNQQRIVKYLPYREDPAIQIFDAVISIVSPFLFGLTGPELRYYVALAANALGIVSMAMPEPPDDRDRP